MLRNHLDQKVKTIFFENHQLTQIVLNTSWMIIANVIAKLSKFAMMIVVIELGPTIFSNFLHCNFSSNVFYIIRYWAQFINY